MKRSRPATPLRHRLPNPPGLFVGRSRELDWLSERLEALALVVVCGPGGIGKTALVLQALKGLDHAENPLFIATQPGSNVDDLRRQMLELCASISGTADEMDLASISADPELAAATIIDLAESSRMTFFIDDVHHCSGPELDDLLTLLAAHARVSRFVFTSQPRPRVTHLAGQICTLGGLSEADLLELGRWVAPDQEASVLLDGAHRAGGSPWHLLQFLGGGNEDDLLGTLTVHELRVLQALTALEDPTSEAIVLAVCDFVDAASIQALEARGLVSRLANGIRAHDVVRSLVLERFLDEVAAERSRLAGILAERGDVESTLSALRMWSAVGGVESMVTLLDAQAPALFAHGETPKLWRLLRLAQDPRLAVYKLRCVAELGNATSFASVTNPKLTSGRDRLSWARAQYLMGELSGALEQALQVPEAGESGRVARVLAARCAFALGDRAQALELLSSKGDIESRALHALLHALDSDDAEAPAKLADEVDATQAMEAAIDVAEALYLSNDRDRASALLDRVIASERGRRASLLLSRRALLLRARMWLDEGRFHEVAKLLEVVRPYARGPSILRPRLLELDAERRLYTGRLSRLEGVLENATNLACVFDRDCADRLRELSADLKELRLGSTYQPDKTPLRPGYLAENRRLRRDVRHLLATGDIDRAADAAHSMVAAADGLTGARLLALSTLCDVLMSGLAFEELARTATELGSLADQVEAERFRRHASYFLDWTEVSTLECLAAGEDVAPMIARRAQVHLGGRPALDPVDERVTSVAMLSWEDVDIDVVSSPPAGTGWAPAWGIDERSREAWFADGRRVSFVKKDLAWRILSAAVNAGGVVSKEVLINQAWGEANYHPGRHNQKIYVNIRSLRHVLEDDPSKPRRLLTTEEGYQLGGLVRRVRSRPSG